MYSGWLFEMGYLICGNCDIYYEVEDDFDKESFDNCEQCGEKLKFYYSFDDYYNEFPVPIGKVLCLIKVILKKKVPNIIQCNYRYYFRIIGLIGFFMVSVFLLVLTLIGLF